MTIFLIKLSLWWGFFALLYMLLLQQETFFRANRGYLLTTLILGLGLASMVDEQIPELVYGSGEQVLAMPVFTVGIQQAGAVANKWKNIDYLWVIYWIGFLLAASRMVWGLLSLSRMVRQSHQERLPDGCRLLHVKAAATPFSFFHWIFIPQVSARCSPDTDGLAAMVAHERAHARGWHSADVLLAEILCVVFWFHPLVYWYKKALRAVHEFLADASASRHTDKKQYGLLLIKQSQSGIPIAFANHFFQSPLKQRLVMLTKKTSSPVRAVKFGLIAPLTLIFALFFRQIPITAQVAAQAQPASKSANAEPEFPGGMEALMQYLPNQIKYPESARTEKAEGTVVVGFVVQEDGSLTDIEAVKTRQTVHPDLTAEAIRVVSMMPKWKPAIQQGKTVKMKFNLPIRFKLDEAPAQAMFDVDKMPEFPGGDKLMMEFLAKNIQYPEEARKANASGMVVTKFIVEKDGSLSSFETLRTPHPDMADEAIRVLKLMPHFTPGLKNNNAVRVQYTLPIRFEL